jgi:hypothetical protein
MLTAAAAMAGETEVATTALHGLLRAQLVFSLAWTAGNIPFKRAADRERSLPPLWLGLTPPRCLVQPNVRDGSWLCENEIRTEFLHSQGQSLRSWSSPTAQLARC